MFIAKTIQEMRTRRREMPGRVALVPTMGALHDGHLSLIHSAKPHADHVLASIFVNPMQFAPHEDFDRYPRPIEKDLAACEAAGVTGIFCPTVDEMYPPDLSPVRLHVPQLTGVLEGAFRPDFFFGVCRVVLKLLNIIQPHLALFGQKDYQQWCVIDAMVRDLNLPIEIAACPTVRESDGLALSSRNVYLSDTDRKHALGLYKALSEAAAMIEEQGEADPANVEHAMLRTLQAYQVKVDYATIRHPRTLQPVDCIEPQLTDGVVALIAGHVGNVRLIDNMILGREE